MNLSDFSSTITALLFRHGNRYRLVGKYSQLGCHLSVPAGGGFGILSEAFNSRVMGFLLKGGTDKEGKNAGGMGDLASFSLYVIWPPLWWTITGVVALTFGRFVSGLFSREPNSPIRTTLGHLSYLFFRQRRTISLHMASKPVLSRLDEISRQYGSKDKEMALANLAHKVLTLLQGKNGVLDTDDKADLSSIADIVVKIGNRHFEPGDPDDNLSKRHKGLSRGGAIKPSGVGSRRAEPKQRD